MPAIDMRRYEKLCAKGKTEKRQPEGKERKIEKRTLDQWRGGRVSLADLFTEAASEEKEEGKGGRESFGEPKPKGPDQDKVQKRRRDRDNDPGR